MKLDFIKEALEQIEEAHNYAHKGPAALRNQKSDPRTPIGKEGSKRNRHINAVVDLVRQIDPRGPITPEHHAKILAKLEKLKE